MTPNLAESPDFTAQFWRNIKNGHLEFARCDNCSYAWLPVSRECPQCLRAGWRFEKTAGSGILLSWVVYNRAYNDLWADRLPYVVALVQLDEGPRMMTNLVGSYDLAKLRIDHPVRLQIEDERGTAVPRFVPIGAEREGDEIR